MRHRTNTVLKSLTILATLGMVGGPAVRARAQSCHIYESGAIGASPQVSAFDEFGTAIAVSGDTAIIGAPGYPIVIARPGAVFAFEFDGANWNQVQMLVAGDGAHGDQFGAAVAMSGDFAIVGAAGDDDLIANGGSGYIFERVNGSWILRQKLYAPVPLTGEQFGWSVAIDGPVVVIGSNLVTFAQTPGNAYIFRRSESNWTFEQQLSPSDGAIWDQFGYRVAVSASTVIIGAPQHDSLGLNASGAYAFRHDGNVWTQSQKLEANDGAAGDRFGAAIATRDEETIIGSPFNGRGAAYVWMDDGTTLTLAQELQTAADSTAGEFGSSVAIDADVLAIGAPSTTRMNVWIPIGALTNFHSAGSFYLFERDQTQWRELFQGWEREPDSFARLGNSVGVAESSIITGASAAQPARAVIFSLTVEDCDGNGVPDTCDVDCNRNHDSDACELMQGRALDCNANSVPDECEATFAYQYDHGPITQALGYAYPNEFDFMWLNQFEVAHGGEVITHVALPWSPFVLLGSPVDLRIYSDPNQDGNPSDALLLAQSSAQMFTDDADLTLPVRLARIALPPTRVGKPGDRFFIGAFFRVIGGAYPAYADLSLPNAGRSWYFTAPLNTLDPQNPGSTDTPSLNTRNWWLRALALDCNGNGSWDQCDIDSGFSVDLNANGVPDECDAPCDADIAPSGGGGDGHVDIDDFLVVINSWDATGPVGTVPGDVAPPGGDGVVNIDDLLAMVNAWGACP